MRWKTLVKMADADSISTTVYDDTGVVKVAFEINGALVTAQYDADNVGIYAFSMEGNSILFMLGLDENGLPLPDKPEQS